MGRREKNSHTRKQDTFMSICKISGWLLFFIVITGIFTIIATNNLFEKHNADLVGIEPNYSYSDLPMKFHHFGEYNACIGRYKHMIRFCKDCGYEDTKSQSSIFQ